MSQVIIGMDPHKRSATIEVMTADETVAGGGRYGTDPTWLMITVCGLDRRADLRLPGSRLADLRTNRACGAAA
jgi:hypothetical protein